MRLDRIDVRLLDLLQHDSRIKSTELAETVGLSLSPCYRRLRLMEEAGVIQGYVARVDPMRAGFPVDAHVSVAIDKRIGGAMDAFAQEIAAHDDVMACFVVAGRFDYLLHVVAPDVAGVDRFVTTKLPRLPGVCDIHTSIPLRRVFARTALPVRPTAE